MNLKGVMEVMECHQYVELFLQLIFSVSQSPDYEPSLPISEKSNPLTRDIDRASATCIVRMLQASDAQMFQEGTGTTYKVKINNP